MKHKNQDIELVEVEKIDFTEVEKRLERGESVFITRKREKELEPISVVSKELADLGYNVHL